MSFDSLLKDRCIIQNRTVDTSGKVDKETWTSQATQSKCRAITTTSKRRSSPDSAEKVQYGTFVFMTFHLPKNANIAIHDRIFYPAINGRTLDVIAVIEAGSTKGHHLVAQCDARA